MNGGVIGLFIVAGILVGGTWSLYKQEASKIAVGITGVLAALALAGALLWQF